MRISNKSTGLGMTALAAWLAPSLAFAQEAVAEAAAEAAPAAPVLSEGNTAWMIVATLLVLLMIIPGLALFYGGMVRKKNVLSVLMQCFAITALVSVVWVVVGYSIAFAPGNAFFGGLDKFLMSGVEKGTLSGTIPESIFATFQLMFAAITPALIVGAFADRMKFSVVLWFTTLWVVLVYAPIAHMVWAGDGWLFGSDNPTGNAILDFAGGTVVHINAGVAGLVAAFMIGKRKGLGSESMAPHNLVLTMIGASLLWVGWFGFNAGSALAADGRASYAFLNTHIATAAAVLGWMFAEWILRGKPSVLGALSGAVAGLVAITPACGFVGVGGALIIGAIAGGAGLWGVTGLKAMLGYDDALDCFGVHGVCGIVGAILTGVFALEGVGGVKGVIEGNLSQLWTQLFGVAVTIAYTVVATFVILKVLDVVIGIRVSEETERDGLDFALHGETVHD